MPVFFNKVIILHIYIISPMLNVSLTLLPVSLYSVMVANTSVPGRPRPHRCGWRPPSLRWRTIPLLNREPSRNTSSWADPGDTYEVKSEDGQ